MKRPCHSTCSEQLHLYQYQQPKSILQHCSYLSNLDNSSTLKPDPFCSKLFSNVFLSEMKKKILINDDGIKYTGAFIEVH